MCEIVEFTVNIFFFSISECVAQGEGEEEGEGETQENRVLSPQLQSLSAAGASFAAAAGGVSEGVCALQKEEC